MEGEGVVKRRSCTIRKNDFLPEESFKSWGNYTRALLETPRRLKDRFVTRSSEGVEIGEMKARSSHQMKKTLNWWDLMWLGVGCVIGAGIFVLTGLEARNVAGPAVILSYVVSGVSAMLSVFCYTEFAIEIPVAGGSFAYLRVELGDFVAFIAAGNILMEYVISCAAVSRSWTSYFATLCNKNPDDFRIVIHKMNPNYGHLDPIAVVILSVTCILVVYSTKASSVFNYVASVLHIVIIVFIVIAGLIHAKPQNYVPFAPFGTRGVFHASAVLYFAYVGFDAVATMAEETKNPSRDIPIGLVGSVLISTLAYCLLAGTLCLMQPYTSIDVNAPFSIAFSSIGWDWAKYIVSLGALKGMTTVLLVTTVGQARYLTHISRTHMMPPWFALVDEHTGTPVNATVALVLISAVIGFFTDLEILSNLLSISTLFIFMLVAVALLVRRYYSSGVTTKGNQIKLIVFIVVIIGSSSGISSYWALSDGWIGYAILGPIWVLATGGLWLLVPRAKEPKVWGVPLVPWVPSISIFVNIFLLGSIDKDSFIRFGFWTVLLLVYYVFLGLHASYDKSKEFETQKREMNTLEDGVVVSFFFTDIIKEITIKNCLKLNLVLG